jgi:hypothetical protein
MKNHEFILKYPIPIPKEGGGTVETTKLTMGRVKAKHLRSLPQHYDDKTQPAEMLPFLAALLGIPESSVDEIDVEDLGQLAEGMTSFLGKSLQTGKI